MDKREEEIAPIWKRLTSQIYKSRGSDYENAKNMAKHILIKRGHLNSDGTPTFSGKVRGLMTPRERAVDRAIQKFGGEYDDYRYDPEKNYAYKKRTWKNSRALHGKRS